MNRVVAPLLLAVACITCMACVACGPPERPVLTVDVEVETLSPDECLPDVFDELECAVQGNDIVFDPGCGNRDLDSGEAVSTLNLDPNDVNALVFLRYQGPDQLLRDGGDQGPGRALTGVMLHELTSQVTFDVVAAHDTELVLYTVGLDDVIAVGDVVDLQQDDRELTIEYSVGDRRIQERHSVGRFTDRAVQLDDGRFVNENFCGCSATHGAGAGASAAPLFVVFGAALLWSRGRRSRSPRACLWGP